MTRTENYQLPQWEAQDTLRREDLNEAFAALDGCYSAGNSPVAHARFNIYSAASGDTVYTFTKAPVCVLLFGNYMPAAISQNLTGTVANSVSADSAYSATFKLSGTKLLLQARGSSYSDTALQMLMIY